MQAEGYLTKESKIQRNWVGILIVRRLTTALIESAMEYGTVNWDITLYKALSIVLSSAPAIRVGDILEE